MRAIRARKGRIIQPARSASRKVFGFGITLLRMKRKARSEVGRCAFISMRVRASSTRCM